MNIFQCCRNSFWTVVYAICAPRPCMLVCRCWGLPKSYFGQGQITFGPVSGLVHKMQTRAPPKPVSWHWKITFGQVSLSLRMQTPKTCFQDWKITFGQVLGWFAGQGAESVPSGYTLESPRTCLKYLGSDQPKVSK